MTIVIAASRERPNESSNADSEVALMNRPPVLQRTAAPRTSTSGDTPVGSISERVAWVTCLDGRRALKRRNEKGTTVRSWIEFDQSNRGPTPASHLGPESLNNLGYRVFA